jgi:hypothetical protein
VPTRATVVLLTFYAIAAVSFALGLVALGRADDVMAVVLGILGGLSLRALRRASKLAEAAR